MYFYQWIIQFKNEIYFLESKMIQGLDWLCQFDPQSNHTTTS